MTVLAIIQARMGSSRFPGKVLMKIEGKPVLQHIIEFLNHSKLIDKIVVATTSLTEDEKIIRLLKDLNCSYYKGNPDNLLARYYECAKKFGGDLIVRITADNPLIDPEIVDEGIRIYRETNSDYVSNMINQTFPIGYLVEILTFDILKKLFETNQNSISQEHVTYDIRKNPHLYKTSEIFALPHLCRPNWRLTIDYPEDFILINKIFSKLYVPDSYIRYQSVVDFLDNNLDLLEINKQNSN